MSRQISIIFLLLFSFSSFSAEKYTVIGNTRSNDDYIQHLISECQEKEDTELSQCLMNRQIFTKVEITGNNIVVEERWTLIPVPQVSGGSDTSSFGIFVMDTNFLGRGKVAVAGVSVGSAADSYFLLYKDPELFLTDWTSSVMIQSSENDVKAYSGKDEIYNFTQNQTGARLGIGHKFFSDYEVGVGGSFTKKKFKKLDNYIIPEENTALGVDLNFRYKNSDFKFYFNEGLDADLALATDVNRTDAEEKVQIAAVNVRYQQNTYSQHALQIGLSSTATKNATVKDLARFGGARGARGVQDSALWVKSLTSLSVDYQIPVLFSSYGVWTVSPFADYGIFKSDVNTFSNYNSYGVGAYLFLKNVAVPGMGILIGKNDRFQGSFVSFSIGLQP